MPVVEVNNLTFSYGDRCALQGVSFWVDKGEIFGLLGPNGGGKTTVFRLLCTLLVAERGQARVLGWDVRENPFQVRRQIGVVFQSNSLDVQLTVSENLIHEGHLYGLRGQELQNRVDEMLSRLGLRRT